MLPRSSTPVPAVRRGCSRGRGILLRSEWLRRCRRRRGGSRCCFLLELSVTSGMSKYVSNKFTGGRQGREGGRGLCCFGGWGRELGGRVSSLDDVGIAGTVSRYCTHVDGRAHSCENFQRGV